MEPRGALLRVEEIGGLSRDELQSFFSAFGDVREVTTTIRSGQPVAFVELNQEMEELVEAALGYHFIGDSHVFVRRGETWDLIGNTSSRATTSAEYTSRASGTTPVEYATSVPNPGLDPNQLTYEGIWAGVYKESEVSGRSSFIKSGALRDMYAGKDAILHHKECPWVETMGLRVGDAVQFQIWVWEGVRPHATRIVKAGAGLAASETAPEMASQVAEVVVDAIDVIQSASQHPHVGGKRPVRPPPVRPPPRPAPVAGLPLRNALAGQFSSKRDRSPSGSTSSSSSSSSRHRKKKKKKKRKREEEDVAVLAGQIRMRMQYAMYSRMLMGSSGAGLSGDISIPLRGAAYAPRSSAEERLHRAAQQRGIVAAQERPAVRSAEALERRAVRHAERRAQAGL